MASSTIIKYILAASSIITVLLFPIHSSCQEFRNNTSPEQRGQQLMSRLKEQLVLSDQQVDSIQPILFFYAKRMNEFRDSLSNLQLDSIRTILQPIEQQRNLAIRNFLTEDQFTLYLQFLEEQKARRRQRLQEQR